MTGAAWGRHPGGETLGTIVIELRSVNARGLTVKQRLPSELSGCERAIEERVRARIARGTIFVTVALERVGPDLGAVVDPERFAAAAQHLTALAGASGLGAPTVRDVLTIPGVVAAPSTSRDPATGRTDTPPDGLLAGLDAALDALIVSRLAEGAELARGLAELLDHLERGLDQVTLRAPELAVLYRERLLGRVGEFLRAQGATLEPADVVQQVALYADKVDVAEEIERLRSHLVRARAMLHEGGALGRTLEFLIQEMLREVNTIGSKSPDVEIAHVVVDMKTTVDRLKEQVANLE